MYCNPFKHVHWHAAVGGAVVALAGVKFLKSKTARKAAVNAVACGMKLQDDAMKTVQTIKEDAQDVYNEAKEQAKAE